MTETISTRAHIGVIRLAGHIGAEISGVDTGEVLSDDAVAQIRQALLDHKVVFLATRASITPGRLPSPSGSAR